MLNNDNRSFSIENNFNDNTISNGNPNYIDNEYLAEHLQLNYKKDVKHQTIKRKQFENKLIDNLTSEHNNQQEAFETNLFNDIDEIITQEDKQTALPIIRETFPSAEVTVCLFCNGFLLADEYIHCTANCFTPFKSTFLTENQLSLANFSNLLSLFKSEHRYCFEERQSFILISQSPLTINCNSCLEQFFN